MNGRNRHMQYRRSVYRRRRLKVTLILLAILPVLLAVVLLIVGNAMKRKVESNAPGEEPSKESATAGEAEKRPIAELKARPVLLETTDSTTFATRLRALTEAGISAASVPLNQTDGKLLYHSAIGTAIGYPVLGTPSVSLAHVAEATAETGVYLSGVFYLTAFAEPDDLLRSVELSRSTTLIAEALRAGFNDVLLLAPSLTADQVGEVLRLMDDVRHLVPNATLGFALPDAVIGAEDSAALIDTLWSKADFLALGAYAYGETDPVSFATQTVNNANTLYNRLRYHMRVLLPSCADLAQTDAVIAAVEGNGVSNWQILP